MVASLLRNAAYAVAGTIFLASCFYGSAFLFAPVHAAAQLGVMPPVDGRNPWWRLVFPLTAGALKPDTTMDSLPWMAEAAPFFLFGVVAEVVMALLKPGKRRVFLLSDSVSSIALGLLQQIGQAGFKLPFAGLYIYIWTHWRLLDVPEDSAALWWLGMLLVDHAYYWAHRFGHVWSVMWASHAVHHSSTEYNLTTALRQNLINAVFGHFLYLPAALFVPFRLVASHMVFNLLYQYWIHTRMIGRLPWIIEFIFNTPSHHAVHHGRNPACIDKNFAGMLIIFDRLYGTFFDEAWMPVVKQPEDGKPVVGPDGQPVREEIVYGVIPPLQTISPITANLIEWQDLWHRLRTTPRWVDRLKIPFISPGWRYSAKEGGLKWVPVGPIGHKYNPVRGYEPPSPGVFASIYAVVQLLLLAAMYFIPTIPWGTPLNGVVGALLFAPSLHCVTSILECSPRALGWEAVRLVSSIAFVGYLHVARPAALATSLMATDQAHAIAVGLLAASLCAVGLMAATGGIPERPTSGTAPAAAPVPSAGGAKAAKSA